MKRPIIFLLLPILLLASCELVQDQPPQGKVYGVFIGLDYDNATWHGGEGFLEGPSTTPAS